jgi:hypothetical protein
MLRVSLAGRLVGARVAYVSVCICWRVPGRHRARSKRRRLRLVITAWTALSLQDPLRPAYFSRWVKSGDLSPCRGNAPPPPTRLRIRHVDFESPGPPHTIGHGRTAAHAPHHTSPRRTCVLLDRFLSLAILLLHKLARIERPAPAAHGGVGFVVLGGQPGPRRPLRRTAEPGDVTDLGDGHRAQYRPIPGGVCTAANRGAWPAGRWSAW